MSILDLVLRVYIQLRKMMTEDSEDSEFKASLSHIDRIFKNTFLKL